MLEGFFRPRAIAVVGVAREPGKVGHFVFRKILDGGFAGPVYPVNNRADKILGQRAYPNLRELPGPVDLAVVAVPAAVVADVVDDAAAAGIPAISVLSAGFKETGPQGARLERDVAERARQAGIRLLGPNSLGLVSSPGRVDAAFAAARPVAGGVAVLSQSGALGTALLDRASDGPPGLAYFVSLGNRADVAEDELLRAWAEDDDVSVIGAYLESVRDGQAFLSASRAASDRKPVVVLKSGASDAGARAVSSHTGSLAGSDAAYDAALLAAGALRVHDAEEFLDALTSFALQPPPERRGLAVLTNAGGLGVLATDAAERFGVELASLDAHTVARLRGVLPEAAAFYNPVDILGDADPERFAQAARILGEDAGVGSIVVLLTPQAMTEATTTARRLSEELRGGPTVFAAFVGGESLDESRSVLRDAKIPEFDTPERAIRALSLMERWLRRPSPRQLQLEGCRETAQPDTLAIIEQARRSGRAFVTDADADRIARLWGIAIPDSAMAADLDEALEAAERIGYPVVMKISSPDILHKTDVGGVVADIGGPDALREAYVNLRARVERRAPHAWIQGVYLQKMLPPGVELIVGMDRDPTFGPLLMVGLGGVLVEVMRDVVFRVCPVDEAEARAMLAELRGYALLRGVRGSGASDLDAAATLIARASALVCTIDDIVEFDLNPVIVAPGDGGAVAVDIRIGIGG